MAASLAEPGYRSWVFDVAGRNAPGSWFLSDTISRLDRPILELVLAGRSP